MADFYYSERDFGYRVLEDGTSYLHVRRESIVCMVKRLESVPITYRWTGSGEISLKTEPESLTVHDQQKVVGKVETRKSIVFETPLKKRQRCTYALVMQCAATQVQPEAFLASGSRRRVDKLILRVAFPVNRRPTRVTYRILDGDGCEKSHEALECADYLTSEFRKEIRYPKPFSEHRIEWEW